MLRVKRGVKHPLSLLAKYFTSLYNTPKHSDNIAHLFQLVGNEKHLVLANVRKGWLVTCQSYVLLLERDQTLEVSLANFLHADWGTSWCMVN